MLKLLIWISMIAMAWIALQIPSWILCHHRWSESGLETKYILGGGCQVGYDGEYTPEKNIRRNY